MDYLKAFLVGGAICAIGQVMLSRTSMASPRILVLFVVVGVILGALGLYQPLMEFAGAGASIPLTGFGNTLAQGAIDGAKESGILGAFTGGLKAASGGVAAAILFGYLNAVLFKPRTKK